MKTIKRWFQKTLAPTKEGLVYANRFTVIACMVTTLMELSVFIYYLSIRKSEDISWVQNIFGNVQVVSIIMLFIGGIVWAACSTLDKKIHTLFIYMVMFVILQILFSSLGSYTFAANYVVIFMSVIYANPLFTFIIGVIIQVISLVNYFTQSFYYNNPEYDTNIIMDKGLEAYSMNEFVALLAFYMPMIVVTSIMVSYALKRLREHINQYVAEQAIADSNIKAAASIQEQMLDSSGIEEASKDNVTIYPFLKTADYVAGDFYDYYNIDENRICFLIADVSGKGIAAGLYMVKARDVLRIMGRDDITTCELIRKANEELCENNSECMFATVWLGILDLCDGTLEYTNAGHPSPVLISGGKVSLLDEVSGPMLGLFPGKKYRSSKVQLCDGDRLLLYTDGVNEQPISDSERYEEAGIINYVQGHPGEDNLCEGIYEELESFNKEQFDDITMLQIRLDKLISISSKIGKEIDKKVYLAAVPGSVRIARNVIMAEFADTDVDREVLDTFYVACEEIMTNIIMYAYKDSNDGGAFSFYLHAQDDYLSVVIEDTGVEFNPFEYTSDIDVNDPNHLSISGRGIKIFTGIMDEYSYKRISDTNVVTARKYI